MAELLETTVLTDEQIASMLSSDDPYERISAMGHVLSGDVPADGFREALEAIEESDIPSMFGMTEGDIASLTLAATGVRPYEGDNETVMAQLAGF